MGLMRLSILRGRAEICITSTSVSHADNRSTLSFSSFSASSPSHDHHHMISSRANREQSCKAGDRRRMSDEQFEIVTGCLFIAVVEKENTNWILSDGREEGVDFQI